MKDSGRRRAARERLMHQEIANPEDAAQYFRTAQRLDRKVVQDIRVGYGSVQAVEMAMSARHDLPRIES